jgi:lipopolysaccharide export system permease protein
LVALFVWPWQNQHSVELKERFERRSDLSRVAPGQFQSSSDGTRVFFIERDSLDRSNGRNVFILSTLPDTESVTSAHSGRIEWVGDDRYLLLSTGQRNEENLRTGEKTLARFQGYRVQAGERVLSSMDRLPTRARSSLELLREPVPRQQGELVWRLGLLLGGANLTLLGMGLSASNPRRASNWNMLFALLSFVVYYNFINLSQAWVASGKAGMGTALLAVHASAFVIAIALLAWREWRITVIGSLFGWFFALRHRSGSA